jgi:hypothetical protein
MLASASRYAFQHFQEASDPAQLTLLVWQQACDTSAAVAPMMAIHCAPGDPSGDEKLPEAASMNGRYVAMRDMILSNISAFRELVS